MQITVRHRDVAETSIIEYGCADAVPSVMCSLGAAGHVATGLRTLALPSNSRMQPPPLSPPQPKNKYSMLTVDVSHSLMSALNA